MQTLLSNALAAVSVDEAKRICDFYVVDYWDMTDALSPVPTHAEIHNWCVAQNKKDNI